MQGEEDAGGQRNLTQKRNSDVRHIRFLQNGRIRQKKVPSVKQKGKFTLSLAQNAYNNISKICKNPFVGPFFKIENRYFQFIHYE